MNLRYSWFSFILILSGLCTELHAQRGVEGPKPVYRFDVRRNGTSFGSFEVELFPFIAPKAVRYFDSLVSIRFYDTTAFHRVIPKFMIQGGDPNSRHGARSTWGTGDNSQQNVEAEFSPVQYTRGILGAARETDTNTANSQFFICVANATHLNNIYTVYGRATKGMNIVDSIVLSPRDGADNPLTKIEMFVEKVGSNDSIPPAPVNTLPAEGAEGVPASTVLTWTRSSGAVLYELELSEDSSFQQILAKKTVGLTISTQTGPDFTSIAGLDKPFHRYFWRVRANNGGHYSAYSKPTSFRTAIGRPTLHRPDSAASSLALSQRFSWRAVDGAQAYHLRIATSPLFLASATFLNKTDIADTSYMVEGLANDKQYYWRVSALRASVESPASETWSFRTELSSSVDSEHASTFESISYPLPASDELRVKLQTEADEVIMYDMQSCMVQRARCTMIKNPSSELIIDVSALPNGTYVLEQRGLGGSTFQRVLIQH